MHQIARKTLLITTALLGLGGAAIGLTGCSGDLESALTHRETVTYADKKDAAAHKSEYFGLNVPDWVPADATDIKITNRTDGRGYLLTFRSAAGVAAMDECPPAGDAPPLMPAITAGWWPETLPTQGRLLCGDRDMEIAHDGDVWYAWR